MNLAETAEVPGRQCVGLTKDKRWSQWLPKRDDWSDADRRQWKTEQRHKRKQQQQVKQQRYAAALPAVERDRHYRNLLSQLTLHPEDRTDLHRRGVTDEQIEAWGVRSVEQGQRLKAALPSTLPGVSLNGRSLNISQAGYLCPIKNTDDLIVGFQTRLRTAEAGGSYRWVSSVTKTNPHGASPHLLNGELPLAVHRPSQVERKAIAFVEGVGAKPFLTSQQLGVATIGAAGGQFASSPKTLRKELDRLSIELETKTIEFYVDAGSVFNEAVLRQYRSTWEMLMKFGFKVQIGWWGQTTKLKHTDIDELEDLEKIQLVSVERFEAIVATEQIQAELNSLRIKPTITTEGRYIQPGSMPLPEKPGIILVNAPMGTGKTSTQLKELVEQHRKRYPNAFRGLIVPRNMLGFQSGAILGLPHHTQHNGFSIPNEATFCLESGWKFPIERLSHEPPLIILDEPSQTIKQILQGNTCGNHHAFILNRFRELLRYAKEQGGWIVLSEDGLTNLELNFTQEASGLEVVEFFKFTRTERVSRDYRIFDSSSMTWSEIQNRLQAGENIVLASDAQKWLRETERMAIASGISKEQIWIIDRDSSELPWAKDFVASPDTFIAKHKPRIVGFSPSVNSGVSIDDKAGYFSSMALNLVHLEPREAKQLVDRLRTDVARFGYVKRSGTTDNDLCSGSRPEAILRDLYRNVEGVNKLTDFANYAIKKAPVNSEGEQLDITGMMAWLKAGRGDSISDYSFYLKHWARYKARETYSKLKLRDNLVSIWESQEHKVELLENSKNKALADHRKQIRGELDREEAVAFAESDASHLSTDDARVILQTPGATTGDRRTAYKRLLQHKLPGCPLDDVEFALKAVTENNGKFLKSAELLWLAQNPEAAKQLDRWNWLGAFTNAGKRQEIIWLPKLSCRSAQAKLLHECPLLPFIEGKITEWGKNTLEAIAVHEWAVLHLHQFRRYLRLTIYKDHSPVKTVNKLLRKLGFDVTTCGRKGKKGEQEYQYCLNNLENCDRDLILKALTERFLQSCTDKGDEALVEATSGVAAHTRAVIPTHTSEVSPDWWTPESLANVKSLWQQADSSEVREVVRRTIPPEVLRRAIA
ncbi:MULTISPECIES: hypothetical protein [Cyanophyceae]|uniref:DUF3854 domain-containing protein n=1 Tax=Stenomitos frigidus AS-A4 TaxID=2933935 RepID=A0ABV0KM80_9CYAN|nr:hypothetical protein [Phormidium sp. FACHB-592]